jgi:hypothetical protein
MARAGGSGSANAIGRLTTWGRSASLIASAAVLLAAGPLAAQTAEQAQKAAQDAIRKLDLQTELPQAPPPPASPWHINLPQELVWVVVAIAAGLLLYAFRDVIPTWRQSTSAAWDEGEGGAGDAATAAPAVVLEAADELAARGRFRDAMHMLLLHGLVHIRERLDLQLSDSLTSREILRNRHLPEGARVSLREVVAQVELTYFGLHPAGASDYAACRQSFNALEAALAAGVRA